MITRHVWEKYIEKAEDIRHVRGNKAIYQKRKETIERIFGTAKEHHGFRYTQYIGKARMEMKAGLTFACMNLKKLARFLGKNGLLNGQKRRFLRNFWIQFNFKGKNGAGMIPAPSLSTVCGLPLWQPLLILLKPDTMHQRLKAIVQDQSKNNS